MRGKTRTKKELEQSGTKALAAWRERDKGKEQQRRKTKWPKTFKFIRKKMKQACVFRCGRA